MVRKSTSGYLPDIPPGLVTADEIVAAMLDAVIAGDLVAGTVVHDESIARHLHVSRTPVREAFLRLRALGVLETAPSRFTRITLVRPQQTIDAYRVWTWLFRLVCREVVPIAPPELAETLERLGRDYAEALVEDRYADMGVANFNFFAAPLVYCDNPVLVDQVRRTTYLLRLGDTQLAYRTDMGLIGRAQDVLVDAVRSRDAVRAAEANDLLDRLMIPSEDSDNDADAGATADPISDVTIEAFEVRGTKKAAFDRAAADDRH